jgi:hypothetical protein
VLTHFLPAAIWTSYSECAYSVFAGSHMDELLNLIVPGSLR